MTQFGVHASFAVEGNQHPSPRQFEALFHRLDYAVLDAQILTRGREPSGWPPRRVAREALLRDPDAPYVLSFSYESPISAWLADSRKKRAATILVVAALYFNAFEKAERGLAGAIDGATEIVQSVERLWHELETFGEGSDDASSRRSAPPMQLQVPRRKGVADGRRIAEPRIDLEKLELRRLDD